MSITGAVRHHVNPEVWKEDGVGAEIQERWLGCLATAKVISMPRLWFNQARTLQRFTAELIVVINAVCREDTRCRTHGAEAPSNHERGKRLKRIFGMRECMYRREASREARTSDVRGRVSVFSSIPRTVFIRSITSVQRTPKPSGHAPFFFRGQKRHAHARHTPTATPTTTTTHPRIHTSDTWTHS